MYFEENIQIVFCYNPPPLPKRPAILKVLNSDDNFSNENDVRYAFGSNDAFWFQLA